MLFADVHGSTGRVQHLDPEQVADLLGPLLRAMTDVVARYEGVSSSRGDGIIALFGPPLLAENHGLRACVAALEILERVDQLEGGLRVRIGVHVGDVLIFADGEGRPRMDQLFGSPIHVAARLEQTAEPGTACISTALHELVRDVIDAVPLPAVAVKGIDAPVGRMRLSGRRGGAGLKVSRTRGLTFFVGRERETELLRAAAAETGPGVRLVQIVGEAGIGKSRLLQEFLACEPARTRYLVALVGNKLRSRLPFDTVGEWLRDTLGLPAPGDPAARRAALDTALAPFPAFSAVQRRALEQVLGLSPPPSMAEEGGLVLGPLLDVAEPVASVLRQLVAGRAILIVCEDFDWFDAASRTLLAELLKGLAAHSVLVVTTSRARLALGIETAGPAQRIRLGPLRDTDARRIVASLAAPLAQDADRLTQLLVNAGGNPLYLEEVSTLAGQAAVELGGVPAIPNRIEALIVDRLSRLPDERRRVLRIAAVIGYEVPTEILQRLTELAPDALRRVLLRLQSEHLLYESRALPPSQFSFRHALTREVAYKSMLRAHRQRLHSEIAVLLETGSLGDPADRLEELCYHTARGGLAEKAVRYLQQAAGVAADRRAPAQAEAYLRNALDVAGTLPDPDRRRRASVEILLGRRTLAELDLRYLDALERLDEAQALADELGDPALLLLVRVRRLRALTVLGRLQEAIDAGEELRSLCSGRTDPALTVEVAHYLAQAYFYVGDFQRADALFSDVYDMLDAQPQSAPIRAGSLAALILATRAAARAFIGKFAAAERDVTDALGRADVTGRAYDRVYAQFIQGLVLLLERKLDDAVSVFRAALELAGAEGVLAFIPSLQSGLGHALILQQDAGAAELAGAIELLEAARATTEDRRREIIRLWATLTLAMAYCAAGQDEPAVRLSAEAVELGSSLGMNGFLVIALRHRALILAASEPDSPAEARACLVAGLRLARRLGMVPEAARLLIAHDVIEGTHAPLRRALACRLLDRVGLPPLEPPPSLRDPF